MFSKSISGTNECFVCGYRVEWETMAASTPGRMTVQRIPDVVAQVCAVGRTEEEKVIYEIECTCPRCKTKNKYTITE